MACSEFQQFQGLCGATSDGYILVETFQTGLECNDSAELHIVADHSVTPSEETLLGPVYDGKAIAITATNLAALVAGEIIAAVIFNRGQSNEIIVYSDDAEVVNAGGMLTFRWGVMQYAPPLQAVTLTTDDAITAELSLLTATAEIRAGGVAWELATWDYYSAPTPFVVDQNSALSWSNNVPKAVSLSYDAGTNIITLSVEGNDVTITFPAPEDFPPSPIVLIRAAVSDTSLFGVDVTDVVFNGDSTTVPDVIVVHNAIDRVEGVLIRGFDNTQSWTLTFNQTIRWFTATVPTSSQSAVQVQFGFPACATTLTMTIDQNDVTSINTACSQPFSDLGLGVGNRHVMQTEWLTKPETDPTLTPELWLFVKDRDPLNLGKFTDGSTFRLTWDIRYTIENETVYFGLRFANEEGNHLYWLFSSGPGAEVQLLEDCIVIDFADYIGAGTTIGNTFYEMVNVQSDSFLCPSFGDEQRWRIRIYDCCIDCTKPYDNSVFCESTHDESSFAYRDLTNPGLAKQVFVTGPDGAAPTRSISLVRSGDAFDEDLKLRYSSQKWVMVWDLELNRLIDFYPQQWLRHGAAAYFQHQTFRKDIKAGQSSRKPYYVEIVDLGLVFNAQGSYSLDKDEWGQRSHNWDVPSKLIGLPQNNQQRPMEGWAKSDAMSMEQLYAEFNQQAVSPFLHHTVPQAVQAQRQRFFSDRDLFLDHTTRQRFHDQFMFLIKEIAEKLLRDLDDMVEQQKHLVDSFNPEITDTFAHFTTVILNSISNKILKTKNDLSGGVFGRTALESNEESSGDWLRYIYGELRRLVELDKIDKKDVQLGILKGLTDIDPNNPSSALEALRNAIPIDALQQEYELGANGRIPAGAGLNDPDTLEENRIRGLAK